MNNERHKNYLDYLSVLSILAVIFLHHNGIVHTFSNTREWKESLVVECVFYFAVPLFLMISGAKLLDYRERYSTKDYLIKRVKRVLTPLLFWQSFFWIWKISTNQIENSIFDFNAFMTRVLSSDIQGTFYYIFLIVGLYLTIPILTPLSEEKNKKLLEYSIFVLFIFNAFINNIKYLIGFSIDSNFKIYIDNYIIYILLGYYLSKYDVRQWIRIAIYILAVFAVIYRFGFTYYLSIDNNQLRRDVWGYTQFHTVILACAVFILGKTIFQRQKKLNDFFRVLSDSTFGVYLIHTFVMYYEKQILLLSEESYLWRIILPFITYVLSVLLEKLIKRIPYIGKLIL